MIYHLLFPITQRLFDTDRDLTFSINHIRSRRPSVLYFVLHCFDNSVDENGVPINEIGTYTSSRWVIGTVYDHYEETFQQSSITLDTGKVLDDIAYTRLELVTLGIDSENPLYFTEVMFQEDAFDEYHEPSEEIKSVLVGFRNNATANLYDEDGNYLQVIRPNKENFHTDKLDGAEVTILAPHFNDDEGFDDHIGVFMEAMNQTEQTINVLR